jgi:hypothetical protein
VSPHTVPPPFELEGICVGSLASPFQASCCTATQSLNLFLMDALVKWKPAQQRQNLQLPPCLASHRVGGGTTSTRGCPGKNHDIFSVLCCARVSILPSLCIPALIFIIINFLAALGFELRALPLLGRCCYPLSPSASPFFRGWVF